MRQFFKDEESPHEKLSGKLFVSLTTFNGFRPINELVSEFETKSEFLDALSAGGAIPFFTGEPLTSRYKGRIAIDGGFTLNTPIFTDGKNPQILINLGYVDYPMRYTLSPLDKNHDKLVFQGMDDIVAFFRGAEVKSLKLIPQTSGVKTTGECEDDLVKSELRQLIKALNDLYTTTIHTLKYDILPWSYNCRWSFAAAVIFVYSLGVYDEF